MNLGVPVPILRIFSVEKAYAHYLDYLGFSLDWEHRFEAGCPLYAQISRDHVKIHLSEHYGDATPGATVFLPVADIDMLHRELAARPYAYANPAIEAMAWGKQMQIADPFGNRLRLCQQG